ncbi:MAG: Gfo/Idh/MocA family oxidoreductase [Acidimicrobiales bacterium]|nr:Gfo/Idh/MocA family oxidoreductase [Acidimicrobiales bacterium]
MVPIRFGVLGAAKIAPNAIVTPAAASTDAEVVAVAARDRARAEAFAARHDVARVHSSYDDLLADPEVDAVYNPLPNGLHGRWTVAALEAGKHVLCEKPFTANADEARAVARVAEGTDRVLMEAFHWRYHPMTARLLEIVRGGELGELRHVAGAFCFPLPRKGDIRWSGALAGGALMDAGCYPVHWVRTVVGTEPEVVSAECDEGWGGVDRATRARLAFPDGPTGAVTCSMWSRRLAAIWLRVEGSEGVLEARNPLMPPLLGRLRIETGAGRRVEKPWPGTTYAHQLAAFVAAVRDGAPFPTGVDDAIANMEVIDAIYRAAGRRPHEPTP